MRLSPVPQPSWINPSAVGPAPPHADHSPRQPDGCQFIAWHLSTAPPSRGECCAFSATPKGQAPKGRSRASTRAKREGGAVH